MKRIISACLATLCLLAFLAALAACDLGKTKNNDDPLKQAATCKDPFSSEEVRVTIMGGQTQTKTIKTVYDGTNMSDITVTELGGMTTEEKNYYIRQEDGSIAWYSVEDGMSMYIRIPKEKVEDFLDVTFAFYEEYAYTLDSFDTVKTEQKDGATVIEVKGLKSGSLLDGLVDPAGFTQTATVRDGRYETVTFKTSTIIPVVATHSEMTVTETFTYDNVPKVTAPADWDYDNDVDISWEDIQNQLG